MNASPMQIAMEHHRAGRLAEAEAIYRQILQRDPNDAEALHMLGVIAGQTGHSEAAIHLIRRAIGLQPDWAEAHNNLGSILKGSGRLEESIDSCRRAIQLKPDYAEANYNLGNALAGKGQFADAIAAYQRAIELRPDYVDSHNNLGSVFLNAGEVDAAVAAYERAVQLKPDFAEAHNNLGSALWEKRQLDAAIASYERAIQLKPDCGQAYNNLGNALVDKGQIDKAIGCYQAAIDLSPDDPVPDSNLVYTLYFRPGTTNAELLGQSRRWAKRRAEPLKPLTGAHHIDRDPNRRLRIGYVSPDFRGSHCQSFFTVPLLGSHDRGKFEIFCYADVPRPDGVTQRLRQLSDAWRSTVGLNDQRVAELIRADRIDILVDLTMHMAHGRPLVFARKPAPIQAAWLAYPGTTGLDTMDYRLTDPYLDPPGTNDEFYSEQSIRLPHTFWCYDPLSREVVGDLPTVRNGYVTFGCLNNFCKVNDGVMALWSRVLASMPGARLVLLSPVGDHRARVLEKLGVEGARVEFVAHQPRELYLRTYHRIDVVLDTFPYNGHTTTLDSLWMGVPVVTLVGDTVVGRAGLSILCNAGLPELVARDGNEFVRCAVGLASDPARLGRLRECLRARLLGSPLMDAKGFTAAIESAYRRMWENWCSQSS
ncbi:MAG: tetratricopeptide repeat protein [Tepidisphaeraceae bacterium]